jgi:hypothetical protein
MDRKLNNSEKNLSPFLFVHLESHVNWSGCDVGPPWWETGS